MSFAQQQEEVDFANSYNPADKFAGFDRGDDARDDERDQGTRCIGRMTNGADQRVAIIEDFDGDCLWHSVTIDGRRVFFEEDNRQRAILVARWWMSGCHA